MEIVAPDINRLKASFIKNYNTITSKKIMYYPRKTFQENGIPSPYQYIAFKQLIKLFNGKKDFLDSNISVSDLRTDDLVLVDEFKNYFNNRSVKLTFVTGYFYDTGRGKRDKMINFLKELALKNFEIEIFTQDDTLSKEIFNGIDNEALEKKIKINIIDYRINIHYIILEDLNNIENTQFFIEYPHTELYVFRLGFNLCYSKIREKYEADPEKVLNFLINLRQRNNAVKVLGKIKKYLPFLTKFNFGLAIN